MSSTVIAAHTRILGTLSAEGDLVIEGAVAGDVHTTGQLTLGTHAQIAGEVVARDVRIAGRVIKNVRAEGVIHLLATAEVHCDLEAGRVVIDEGALFEGQVRVRRFGASPRATPMTGAAPPRALGPAPIPERVVPERAIAERATAQLPSPERVRSERVIPQLASPGRRPIQRRRPA